VSEFQPLWSRAALDDYDRIGDYIAGKNPVAALKVLNSIDRALVVACDFPLSGRVGRVKDTRERVVDQENYTIIYDISDGHIRVLRIVHQSQQWPSSGKQKHVPRASGDGSV